MVARAEAQPAEEPTTDGQEGERSNPGVVGRWARVVRAALRVRRLQRIWGILGQFLQSFPAELRDRLRTIWPAPSASRRR